MDAFNFLTGVLFVIVIFTAPVLLYFYINHAFKDDWSTQANISHNLIAFLFIVIIVIGFCDIVYSFYIASQVYGQFDEFQEGLVNCSSPVYYSSFISVVIIFLHIFVEVGLIVLLFFWLKGYFRAKCFDDDY